MTYLEITPAPDLNSRRDVIVDYRHVTDALHHATEVHQGGGTTEEKLTSLARAVDNLSAILTEITRALHHGNVTVYNYPGEEFHPGT